MALTKTNFTVNDKFIESVLAGPDDELKDIVKANVTRIEKPAKIIKPRKRKIVL